MTSPETSYTKDVTNELIFLLVTHMTCFDISGPQRKIPRIKATEEKLSNDRPAIESGPGAAKPKNKRLKTSEDFPSGHGHQNHRTDNTKFESERVYALWWQIPNAPGRKPNKKERPAAADSILDVGN
jgi:hypothetical protein